MAKLITIEGPGGSGKTTLGERLARVNNYSFYDLDNYIDKGTPWYSGDLEDAYNFIREDLRQGRNVVVPYWSFKSKNVEEFFPRLKGLEQELNIERVPIMIVSSLQQCIDGDNRREKNLGEDHITKVWNMTYQGLTPEHVLVSNRNYDALNRVNRYLKRVYN